jgi:anaerobic selenocysteine-containing dehydrogenase
MSEATSQNRAEGAAVAPSGAPWRTTPLANFPPPERWNDWVEFDPKAWPKRVEKRYTLIPTICFNCEAACGLVAWVDQRTRRIEKLEGNPHHPGSRGRNCAKGPATLNQIHDPQRVLYPMKRVGPRGSGKFERTSWNEVLETFGARIRKALEENRRTEVMYHVGRPGHDGAMERVLQAWGVDGHNSHTNVCSGAARLGYALWSGGDRPSPDHANAKCILLLSSHLETGHYFNPHAQRIIEGKLKGAKIVTIDVRLSNTASMSDHWLAPYPGTEAALLLGFAHVILTEDLEDKAFLETWVNWREWLQARSEPLSFGRFCELLRAEYARFTPEWVAAETGIDAETIRTVGRLVGQARGAFASHVWRNAASGNLGGWQVARCLQLLNVLTASVGTQGGTALAGTNKFVAKRFNPPPPQDVWSELLYPPEWPLSHHELSFLLPHLVADGRGQIDTYFTRVYNPVWTNPDGFSWIEMLSDEQQIGLHACLTPTWSETALFADYVLPMGHSTERHDVMSQETHAGRWIGFRQPIGRVLAQRAGATPEWTHEVNPGEVWEEDEFWIALSWAIDPDGTMGIRQYFESPYRPGERLTVDDQYRWMFENAVPGLPEAAAEQGLDALEYMRRHGAFAVPGDTLRPHEHSAAVEGAERDEASGTWAKDGKPVAVDADGTPRTGFGTPSKRLELYSPTLVEWGYGEHALPGYIESHLHRSRLAREGADARKHEIALVPTFRLPTQIHTRSANSKWLAELSNSNPVWIHPEDAEPRGIRMGELVRVTTRIGHFVARAWVTEGIRPEVIACSHHLGRWRMDLSGPKDGAQPNGAQAATDHSLGTDAWLAAPVRVERTSSSNWRLVRTGDVTPFTSSDPDSRRVFWSSGGVHQNLTFPVQPDPISGMHCWHQVVTVEPAHSNDRYGDVEVDTSKARLVYQEWLALAAPKEHPAGLRRPEWFARAVRPSPAAYRRG